MKLAAENGIMLADLSIMAPEQKAWLERRQTHHPRTRCLIIHCHACLSMLHETCAILPYCLKLLRVNYVIPY
jgi:hypothetical protein